VLDEAPAPIKLMPWSDFKAIVVDFYEHRLINHAEISGAINTYYVNMDEHVMLYFLDKHKTRR
jgi:hypothetical protein